MMQKVAVVGSGGAGKSTFARALGQRTGVPVIHLDEHYWQPGWIEPTRDDWRITQQRLLSGDIWIADGNYGSTIDIRLARADTVIVLDLPRLTCIIGVLRRWIASRGRPVQAPGCPERPSLDFLRWVWNYPRHGRTRMLASLAHSPGEFSVIRLRSRRAARELLDRVV